MRKYIYKDNLDKEYYERFITNDENPATESSKKALDIALDTRKFEIDLYWKRANYFWLFVAAMFTAFFLIANNLFKVIDHKKEFNTLNSLFLILISFSGYFFSLGWYYVNRASKFWQNNWETHVDLLGKKVYGKLFSTIKSSNRDFWRLSQEFPFSVSKVNQLLSLIVVVLWLIMFLISTGTIFFNYFNLCNALACTFLAFLFLMLISYFFTRYSRSFIKDFKNKDKNISFYLND
jgi:hypothetical protein